MKLGRIKVAAPDGDQARIVAVLEEERRVVDLARAYAAVLRGRGANADGAARVARALFPSSMSQALAAGDSSASRPRPRWAPPTTRASRSTRFPGSPPSTARSSATA